jgi:hypothetical protein
MLEEALSLISIKMEIYLYSGNHDPLLDSSVGRAVSDSEVSQLEMGNRVNEIRELWGKTGTGPAVRFQRHYSGESAEASRYFVEGKR